MSIESEELRKGLVATLFGKKKTSAKMKLVESTAQLCYNKHKQIIVQNLR